ncbi:MAG TPA: Gfo/Idh/MocA family oxidoreductase [Mycobacteriales bacterium]|nr:Gfo/Idh/MocA family oxidoreductase [Mycobacteriales bacterium]
MSLRVGVIGAGNIGADHIRRLATEIAGVTVSAVSDLAAGRAAQAAEQVGARVFADSAALIRSSDVDAVLIASPGETHAALTLGCLDAGKPVLCEKPLATTAADGEKVLAAEAAGRQRLVQVGFMRRYDAGYRQVKAALDSGSIGRPLIVHNVHRNATVPDSFQTEMIITDSMVHEIDVIRWLLGEEIVAVQVLVGRSSPLAAAHLRDPLVVLFHTASGVLADVECFVSCQYGYDVRCEVVAATGAAALVNPVAATVTREQQAAQPVPADWRARFGAAYRTELQEWADGVRSDVVSGPSAWDGYAATRVAGCAVESLAVALRSGPAGGTTVPVELVDKPAIYA